MRTITYNDVPCDFFYVAIDDRCEEAHELAEKKAFISLLVNDGYGNYSQAESILRMPTYGPLSLLKLQDDMQKGWLIYQWYVVVGGIRLSLYNPETQELGSHYLMACEEHIPSKEFRFYVPRKKLSVWERIKAIFQPAIKTWRYDVSMSARPTQNEGEYSFNVTVTEHRRNAERTYLFLNTTSRKDERYTPETVTIHETTDF